MLKYLGTIVATAIVVLFLLVSSVPLLHWFREEGRISELADNRARWESVGLSSYALTLTVECACENLPVGPVLVRVRNERPSDAVLASTGAAVPVPDDPRFPVTVPSLFQYVEAAIDSASASIEVEYDANYGLPRSVFVDPDKDIDGDERHVRISAFDPRIEAAEPSTDSVSLGHGYRRAVRAGRAAGNGRIARRSASSASGSGTAP